MKICTVSVGSGDTDLEFGDEETIVFVRSWDVRFLGGRR